MPLFGYHENRADRVDCGRCDRRGPRVPPLPRDDAAVYEPPANLSEPINVVACAVPDPLPGLERFNDRIWRPKKAVAPLRAPLAYGRERVSLWASPPPSIS